MKKCLLRNVGFIFALMLIAAGPCLSMEPDGRSGKDISHYSFEYFSFLKFNHDQAGRLHTNMKDLLRLTGLSEALFRQITVTTELIDQEGRLASHSEYALSRVMSLEKMTYSPQQNSYAHLFENLRNPIMLPYKYKTTNNALLSAILPIAATDRLTVTPMVSYVFSINGVDRNDVKDRGVLNDKSENFFYGGINLFYSF